MNLGREPLQPSSQLSTPAPTGTIILPPGHEPYVSAEPMGQKQVATAQFRGTGVRAQQGREEPPQRCGQHRGRPLAAGRTSLLEGRETGRGLSCSLNCLPGSPPAGPQFSAQGGHSPGAEMWAWGCRPGWFSWLCPGVGRPAGPQGPSDRDRLWPVLPPTPGALSLSGSPPPGDPLAKVPALPTADHPQAH